MRKLILALGVVLVLSSFTNNTNKKIVLKDIDGTLLKSYPVIEQVNDQYVVTFTTDANTVVTTNTDGDITHIYLMDNGLSNTTVSKTITLNSSRLDFTNYIKSDIVVAATDGNLSTDTWRPLRRPSTVDL